MRRVFIVVVLLIALVAAAVALPRSLTTASHCVTGPYKVQGTATATNGSVTVKVSGKFIESGLSGCFASGTGSYSVNIAGLGTSKGGLAVHTDLMADAGDGWCSYPQAPGVCDKVLYAPSLMKSGSLAGNTAVIVACRVGGNITVTLPDPKWWHLRPNDALLAAHSQLYTCAEAGQIFVTVVTGEPDTQAADRTILLEAVGTGVVSGP